MKRSARWLELAAGTAILASLIIGARWRNLVVAAPAAPPTAAWAPPPVSAPALSPAGAFTPETARLSSETTALAALTADARTTFFALDRAGAWQALTEALGVDQASALWRGWTLAYVVMPGLDPAQNFVEVRDFGRGTAWRIQPEAGSAIFGFALDPAGARLAYLEVNLRVTGRRIPWWLVSVDLADGQKELLLGGQHPDQAALLPIGWAGEGLLLQGVVPFAGKQAALWMLSLPDVRLSQVADPTAYVGAPRLSPDGAWIALPASEAAALPRGYAAGEPPATSLTLLGAETGAAGQAVSAAPEHIFMNAVWGPDSRRLWAVEGAWDAGRATFEQSALAEIVFGPGAAQQKTALRLSAGEVTALAACPGGQWLAARQAEAATEIIGGPAGQPVAVWAGAGRVEWLACLE